MGKTLQLDTLERWREKSTESISLAMDLLDAGFRNGGKAAKQVADGKKDWKTEEFSVFAPYVLSGINRDSLSDTGQDRSFPIEMQRKPILIRKEAYSSAICEMEIFRKAKNLSFKMILIMGNAHSVCVGTVRMHLF